MEPLSGVPEAAPDRNTVLTVIGRARLADIERTCREAAAAEKPFTHVHLLAHGLPSARGTGLLATFAIELFGDDGKAKPASSDDLLNALQPIMLDCQAITLASCYGGGESNPIVPGEGLAFQLHKAGIPIVIGSQFPLTFEGSAILAERFYSSLLQGNDVRFALHDTRLALFDARDSACCDWASLVGYVRLPEGYADHLLDVSLKANMASLDTAQCWADHIVQHRIKASSAFGTVAMQLQRRVEDLSIHLSQAERCGRAGAREENCGLLASAQKRLAEVRFHLWRLNGEEGERLAMLQSLRESRDWYEKAYLGDPDKHWPASLSHHWTGVQLLSLTAVLDGELPDIALWYTVRTAAETAQKVEKDYWAPGSLAELYLLAPLAGQPEALQKAAETLDELTRRTDRHAPDRFPIESTLRQLRRYVEWWTEENGFFRGRPDLSGTASGLIAQWTKAHATV